MIENSDEQIFIKIKLFSRLENQSVLEIGCGDGRISKFIINETDSLIGIDPDAEMIKKAQRNIPEGIFQIGSGEQLKFANEFFDLVIFTLSLHHQDSKKSLREASRVLKENGIILVIEPLPEGEIERIFAIVHNEDPAKLDAQQAIKESGLFLLQSEEFNAHWFFDSKEEMSSSIFNYYEMPFNSTLAQKMYDLLEVDVQTSPLKLSDSMIIQVLSKITQQSHTFGQ